MNSGRVISGLMLLLFALTPVFADDAPATGDDSAAGAKAVVQDVGFTYASPKSKVFITFDKPVTFEKTVSEADKQVIIDIANATIGKKFARRIPTTDQKTNLVMVSPYLSGDNVRLTLQLRDNGGVEVSQDGKTITALIDNKQETTETKADPATDSSSSDQQKPATDAAQAEVAPKGAADAAGSASAPAADTASKSTGVDTASDQTRASGDSIDQFMKAQDSHQYVGKHIWLQFQDTELSDVFQIISEASEFNIILSEGVKGKAMLNLTDIPWDQALDIILKSYHLAAEREGNVLRITTMAAMTAEHEAEAAARKASELAEPIVVKIFPISYADIGSLAKIIRDFMTKDPSAQGAGFAPAVLAPAAAPGVPGGAPAPAVAPSSFGLMGTIQIDNRTNSLIVRDTPSSIEKIKRLIKELDTPTPQILIESKFVDVNENSSSGVTGSLFVSNREADATGQNLFFPASNNNFAAGFNTNIPTSGPAISPSNVGTGGVGLGFVPKVALLPGIGEIGALLSLTEGEGHGRVIASPRVVTQNKQPAKIDSGQQIYLSTTTVGSAGATTGANSAAIQALTTLTVTPQVTNDGSVLLNLIFSQTSPDASNTVAGATLTLDQKDITSTVVVDSGATLVIGGIYSSSTAETASGIPFLRNLPIIGPLFGQKTKSSIKDELFIFVTPRVLNDKEAGIRG